MSDTGEGPSAPPPKATLKKQPKNAVRKSKAERDKLEKEEAKRRAERMREAQADERAAEASRKAQYGYQDERSGRGSRGGDRGRGRVFTRPGRGGRGGFMGAPSFNTHGDGGSLPNTGSRGTGSRGARATSTRGGAKREPQIKTDADGDVSMLGLPPVTKTEKEVYEIDSDEDEEAGQRVDIEHMMTIHNISSTDSDDDIDMTGELAGKGKKLTKGKPSKPPALAPVRIPRHEHPERKLGINTEASAASVSDAKRQLEVHDPDKATTGPGRKSKGKAKEVQYVGEKQLFRGVYIDEDPVIKPDPDDPEAVTEEHGKTKARSPTRARRKSSFKRTKSPGAQTEEEKRERAIQEHEASTIYDELGPSKRILVDGENGPEWVEHDQRTNNVYLFQLPPVMPGLVSATTKVKSEKPPPDTQPTNDATNAPPQPSATESQPIKIEDDGINETATPATTFEPGCVGKLRVHRSGKTTLSWGGTSLQLGMGMDARFLQTVLLIEMPEGETSDTGEPAGTAKSFGQIRGKFVVTPDWSEILK